MEIASPNIDYLLNLINRFCKFYKYIPLFVYPYINNHDTLYTRMIERGSKEGRYVSMEGEHGIANKIINMENAYIQFQNYFLTNNYKIINKRELTNINGEKLLNCISLISYNSDFDEQSRDMILNNDFDIVDNIIRNETIFIK